MAQSSKFCRWGVTVQARKSKTNGKESKRKETVDGLQGPNHYGGEKLNCDNVCLYLSSPYSIAVIKLLPSPANNKPN